MMKQLLIFSLLTVSIFSAGMIRNEPSSPQSFQAQPANQNQNMQIQLSERGNQKLQMVNGMIATTRSGIEFKEHYLIVTGKDPDKRTWVLGVDDIKVIVALQ
jgi:hypothetical protein